MSSEHFKYVQQVKGGEALKICSCVYFQTARGEIPLPLLRPAHREAHARTVSERLSQST